MKFLIKWYDFNYSLTEFFLLIDILKQHTTSIELKQFAVKIMEEYGSFDYTKHYLSKTEKKVIIIIIIFIIMLYSFGIFASIH